MTHTTDSHDSAGPLQRPLVQASFGAPQPQNRWTVAFRLILAVPHLAVAAALGMAAFVLVFFGWFGAVFTGRFPASFRKFVGDYIKYVTRVYAYLWMACGRFPPFNGTSPYPVNVEIPAGPVRRLAVLFRIFLLVPCGIVAALAGAGVWGTSWAIWLIVLVSGRMPLPLFQAVSGVLRYQARYYAYGAMLTGKYPGELLGDAHPPEPAAPSPWAPPWSVQLSAGAKAIVVVFLVVGLATDILEATVRASFGFSFNFNSSSTQLTDAFDTLEGSSSAAKAQLDSCAQSALSCTEAYRTELASAFSAFARTAGTIDVPFYAQDDMDSLVSDSMRLASAFEQGSTAGNAGSAGEQAELQRLVNRFDQDYTTVADELPG